jgi:ubiquinone/menaquinone biosynthesis C-methylase UbiE
MSRMQEMIGRTRYALAQGVRVAWYAAHYAAARRMSAPFDRPGEPAFRPQSPPGQRARIRESFLDVFARDRANIEAGLYPAPQDLGAAAALAAVQASRRFFDDLPKVDARRLARGGVEVRQSNSVHTTQYPAYYLQNFHYQTGGWLSQDSARLYDMQVEVLFAGAADAMRRAALAMLAQSLRGRDQRGVNHLDVACGGGRFLSQIMAAFPRLRAHGIDLSPAYIDEARQALAAWPHVVVGTGRAEALAYDDAAFDSASCIYLFHELPPKVRRDVAREMARVIKPGGVLVFADSLQAGDNPDLDQMLEYFPHGFHEPFFGSYQKEDLAALFGEAGFVVEGDTQAFLTKVIRLRRVGAERN